MKPLIVRQRMSFVWSCSGAIFAAILAVNGPNSLQRPQAHQRPHNPATLDEPYLTLAIFLLLLLEGSNNYY